MRAYAHLMNFDVRCNRCKTDEKLRRQNRTNTPFQLKLQKSIQGYAVLHMLLEFHVELLQVQVT